MAYIGKAPVNGFHAKQTLTGDGSTVTFTLDQTVAVESSIIVSVGGVIQEPKTAYNLANSGASITFTAAPASTDRVYVQFLGTAIVQNLLDVNGAEFILDADADTSLTADTDDEIDIKIAGSDKSTIKATGFHNIDSYKFIAGTGDDLQLYHDGSNSYLANSTGALKVATETSGIAVTIGHTTSEVTFGDNVTVTGNLTIGGTTNFGDFNITNVGSIALDTITNDGTDITLDSSGDIILDAAGNEIKFKAGGTTIGKIYNVSSDLVIKSEVADKDLLFKGDDGASEITALTLDMSDAGAATFNSTVTTTGLVIGSTAVTSTAAELNLLDGVSGLVQADLTKLAALDATAAEINLIDGGTSTGTTAVADADGIITNDGGTMRLTTAATFKTYFQEGISQAYDDFTIGDAAVLITTSSGNITVDAAANDSDIIFKGTDGGADTTFLTIDGSAAGAATFNDKIIATELDISGDIDIDGTTNLDIVDIDGAVNIAADVTIASTNKIIFNDASQFIQGASATVLDIAATDEIELTATLIEVVGNATVSGTLGVTGIATFTDDIIIGDGKTIGSASDVDAITIAADGALHFSQRIGVVSAPDLGTGIHIKTADSGLGSVIAGADELIIEGNGDSGMHILSGASDKGTIAFGDSGDADIGMIQYNHSGNTMAFTVGTAEALKFHSDVVVFNEGGADVNHRFESANNDSMLVIDAGTDRVGVGTGTPGGDFEVKMASNVRFVVDDTQDSQVTLKAIQDSGTKNAMRIVCDNLNVETQTGNNSPVNRLTIASGGEVAINDDSIETGATVFKVKGALNNIPAIFQHQNTSGGQTMILFRDGAIDTCGTIGIAPASNSVSYNTSSDYRLKENVDYDFDATSRLKQLKPARFNWIKDETNTLVDGFLAHEVSSIVPEAIQGEKDAFETYKEHQVKPDDKNVGDFKLDENGDKIPLYQGIDQSKLVPLLVKTIQELEARIKTLEDA